MADSTAEAQRLVDAEVFVLNAAERKFLHVGFDPTENFNVLIHIITPRSYVSMSYLCLFRVMKRLPDDYCGVSLCRTARGEVRFAKIRNGGRSGRGLLLFRPELRALRNEKWSLFYSILKRMVVRDQRRLQFSELLEFLKSKLARKRIASSSNFDDVFAYVNRVPIDKILALAPESERGFISQLKRFACVRVSELWLNERNDLRNRLAEYLVFH